MDAIECMKTRRSVRVYQDKPVPREIIEDIVDCGRLAATAINIQPWQFIVVQDPAMRKRIADTTDYGKFIAQAPVCIAVFARILSITSKMEALQRRTYSMPQERMNSVRAG